MGRETADLVKRLSGRRILVIGDMVADIYIDGRISRISREAPVLVLEQAGEKIVAGGAANVAHNAQTLGGSVYAVGLLGEDAAAQGLADILAEKGVQTAGLFHDAARPTISKTRIIAGGRATVSQQIVRLDKESHAPLRRETEGEMLRYLDEILPQMEGIVLSDYGAGTITEAVKDKLIGYVKQNDAELAAAVGRELPDEAALVDAGRALLKELSADGVLVTRGEQGMMLFSRDGTVTDIPVSDRSEVYDVSGAGDTCVATVILALAAGIEAPEAARLSNVASGIAVRKLGTATVSAAELVRALDAQGDAAD